jgi:hypothetical protein
MRLLRKERTANRADRIIRLIGGLVLFAIVIVIFAAALVFLIKTLSHIFSAASKTAYTISRP